MKLTTTLAIAVSMLPLTLHAQELDGRVKYKLKSIGASLDRAEAALSKKQLRQAETSLKGAERGWKQLQSDYKGRFDPNHADIVSTGKRLERASTQVQAMKDEVQKMAQKLGLLLGALEQNHDMLQNDMKIARQKILAFSSALRQFQQDQKTQRFEPILDELSASAERIHAVLPGARAAASEFRKQYPDLQAVKRLLPGGSSAVQSLQRLEEFPPKWEQVRMKAVQESLASLEKTLLRFESSLPKLASEKNSTKKAQADQAEKIAVDLSDIRLNFARVLLPIGAADKQLKDRISSYESRVHALRKTVAALRKKAVTEEHLRIASSRFPRTRFSGPTWSDAAAAARKAYEKFAPDHPVRRVAIHSPWNERPEVTCTEETWDISTYKYLGATICSQLPSGGFRVYRLTLRQKKAPDGSFGSLTVATVGHSFPILEENIGK